MALDNKNQHEPTPTVGLNLPIKLSGIFGPCFLLPGHHRCTGTLARNVGSMADGLLSPAAGRHIHPAARWAVAAHGPVALVVALIKNPAEALLGQASDSSKNSSSCTGSSTMFSKLHMYIMIWRIKRLKLLWR